MKFIFEILFIVFVFKEMYSDTFENYKNYKKTKSQYKLTQIFNGLDYPFGLSFLDQNNLLVTEKGGRILKINKKSGKMLEIKHKIPVLEFNSLSLSPQQGGLLDIFHNEKDNYTYFTYSHDFKKSNSNEKIKSEFSTAIARGTIENNKIENFQVLLLATPESNINLHWGSRITIKEEHLFAGLGDRGESEMAQDPKKYPGSIIRIKKNGDIPKDNPSFINKPNWLPEIFSIGVRNPQGITISPHDNSIIFSQHGPKGGDNISKVRHGGNFGWKVVGWGGTEYSGRKIGKEAFNDKFDKPLKVWVPSIAVGSINFYKGDSFSEWNGDLIISATKTKMLLRLDYENNKIVDEEIILKNALGRIRDFEIDNSGDIFLITDEKNSSLWKLSK